MSTHTTSIRAVLKVVLSVGAFYAFLKIAFLPFPLPFSLTFMYMSLAVIGALVYMTLFLDIAESIISPLFVFLGGGVEGNVAKGARMVVLVAMPVLIWLFVYSKMNKEPEVPLSQRVIHPAPPGDFMSLHNPYRVEEKERFAEYVEEGRQVYYKNCVFCHGDFLDGNGIFASRMNPPPANFQDPGTIAMLQESFLFWRVSTGGPGLPKESTPWSSAMPQWETMLTEEERWKVILFLYDYTGHSPRTWE